MNHHLAEVTADTLKDINALDCTRVILTLLDAHGASAAAEELFSARYSTSPNRELVRRKLGFHIKAPVGAMGPDTGAVLLPGELSRPLLAVAQPFSILPRLGATRAPFDLSVPIEDVPITDGYWVDHGAAKPLSRWTYGNVTLRRRTAARIIALTNDLRKVGNRAAEGLLRDRLARGLTAYIDVEFLNPVGPFSITNGVTPVATTGSPVTDLANLFAAFVSNGGSVESAVVVMSSQNAIGARLSGEAAFEDLDRQGGRVAGLPAIASDSAGAVVAIIDSARVLLADSGELAIDASEQATLEMRDDPIGATGAAGSPAGPVHTTATSLWQTNSVALKAERFLAWHAAPGAVAYTEADYLLGVGSPA